MSGCTTRATSPYRLRKHRVRPNPICESRQRRVLSSPRPSSGVPSCARSAPLSYRAHSAKIQWEAAHGEPCPYARPAPPRLGRDAKKTLRGPAAAVYNNRSRRHRGLLPKGAPNARQQYGFGSGFYETPDTSTGQQKLWFDNVEREIWRCVYNRTGTTAGVADTEAAARRGRNNTICKKAGIVHQSKIKLDWWRSAAPSLLKMHQRAIDAALLEISRPREGPFENLGERLGGEHDTFTYCSQDGIGSSVGGCGENTGSLSESATNAPKQRASTGKKRPLMRARDLPRPATRSYFRTPTADEPNRSTTLPQLGSHDSWKIPLLRTSWDSRDDGPRRNLEESLGGDTDYVSPRPEFSGEQALEAQPRQESAAGTRFIEDIAQPGTSTGPIAQLNGGTKRCSESSPRPHMISSTTSLSPVGVLILRTAAEGYIEKTISDALLALLDSEGETCRPRAGNFGASLSEASVAGIPISQTIAQNFVEETVLCAVLGLLTEAPEKENLSPNAPGNVQCDGSRLRKEADVAKESRAMENQHSIEYLQQGTQARLARLFGDGTSDSLKPVETDNNTARADLSEKVRRRISVTSASAIGLHGKECCVNEVPSEKAPTSGTTTPMSTDSSSIDFLLNDDSSMETEGREGCAIRVSSGQVTNQQEIHAGNTTRFGQSFPFARTDAIANAAATVVEGWVSGVVSKSACPPTHVVVRPPACISDRMAIANAAAMAVEGWMLGVIGKPACPTAPVVREPVPCTSDRIETAREKDDACVGRTQRDPVTPPGMKALPLGFLKDIRARRASLKSVLTDGPTSRATDEEDSQLGSESRQQRERNADREAKDGVAALQELENLVRANGLDRYDPNDFSREVLYGEGRHSVVYRVCATKPCGEMGMEKEHDGTRSAATKSVVLREAAAAALAKETSVDILATAVAAVTTTTSSSTAAVEEPALSAVLAEAVFEAVLHASLPAVVAAAGTSENGKTTSTVLAAKEFRYVRTDVPVSILRKIHREVCMHLRVSSCGHIVALRGVWVMPRVTILLEPMSGGNLHHFVRARAARDDACKDRFKDGGYETRRQHAGLVAEATEGLAALHNEGIVHRDVKSHNVMVVRRQQRGLLGNTESVVSSCSGREHEINDEIVRCSSGSDGPEWTAKLGDLGSAALIPREGQAALTEEAGTSGWVAPEVFEGQRYGIQADIFSLGVLIWDVFVCGALDNPMCGLSEGKLREGLRPPWPRPPLQVVPPVIERLAERCWALEPEIRPTASAVAAELWAFHTQARAGLGGSDV